jgi:hypothetical protein
VTKALKEDGIEDISGHAHVGELTYVEPDPIIGMAYCLKKGKLVSSKHSSTMCTVMRKTMIQLAQHHIG